MARVVREVMKKQFSIVFSNYTAQIFAWPGSAKANKKYLGNRSIIGTVEAADESEAIALWNSHPASTAA